jgi:hypothetical protein
MTPLRHGLAVFGLAWLALLWVAPPLEGYLLNSDHGYQLSLARLIQLGAFPYVDLVFHYGPMVAWSSALALWLSGSLIGETVLCATGYAVAVACLAGVARARTGRIAGWVVPVLAIVFLARFYKWYFWIFPALALVSLHVHLAGDGKDRRDLLLAGVTAGLCGLFRFDLGVVLLALWLAVAFVGREGLVQRGFVGRVLWVVLGFLVPVGAWLGVLAGVGGIDAVADYRAATFDGASGVVSHWSQAPPRFDPTSPFSPESGLRLALTLLPLVLVAGLALGAWRARRRADTPERDARFLAAAALLGIGLLPQAYYRADGHHLLQALPPVFVVAPLAARQLRLELAARSRPVRRSALVAGALAALTAVVSGAGLLRFGGADLSSPASNGLARWTELARGLEGAPPGPLTAALRRTASIPPEARVLVVPMVPQVYYFAERPMSGVLNMYAPGILDDPHWRERNLRHVAAHPPHLVFTSQAMLHPRSPHARAFQRSQPELSRYLRANYREVAFTRGPWILLRRGAPAP